MIKEKLNDIMASCFLYSLNLVSVVSVMYYIIIICQRFLWTPHTLIARLFKMKYLCQVANMNFLDQ